MLSRTVLRASSRSVRALASAARPVLLARPAPLTFAALRPLRALSSSAPRSDVCKCLPVFVASFELKENRVTAALSTKLAEEIKFEEENAEPGEPDFLKDFKAEGVWTVRWRFGTAVGLLTHAPCRSRTSLEPTRLSSPVPLTTRSPSSVPPFPLKQALTPLNV